MIVVKVGGSAGIDLDAVCANVATLVKAGQRLVLVHGGSHLTNEVATALGHPPQFVTSPSGFTSRLTDRRTLQIFMMVYCGRINKEIVERLQALGVNAMGLSGIDGRLWQGPRKKAIRAVENGRRRIIRHSLTGRVERVNVALLNTLLEAGTVPVLTPPALSDEGEAINVDGDRAAAATAVALGASDLVILSNVAGVLRDYAGDSPSHSKKNETSVLITHISHSELDATIKTHARGRMRIKLLGAKEALAGGVERVVLADGRQERPLQRALAGEGTTITKEYPGGYVQGVDHMNIIDVEDRYTSGVYGKRQVALIKGKGTRVWDADGRQYIDCTAGIGVASVGHAHPAVVAAVAQQAQTLLTCPEMFYNDRRAALLQRLTSHLPPGLTRLFLCNSGTEAVEAALKFARLASGRSDVVAAMRGFHGRTLGALSATHKKRYRQPFVPLVPGFSHVPFADIDRMAEAVTEQTAAVLIEAVQGEGGVRLAPAAYLRKLRQLCHERGALLIVDEVQTGFGRTGRWFACEHAGIVPDLMALGKAMAGGVPMGAVAIGPGVGALAAGLHGSTFGGNPLACAAALATLDVYEQEGLVARSAELGTYFLQRLHAIDSPMVREVRGLGLMAAIELRTRAMPVVHHLMARGILALTAGSTVLRFLPPLVITRQELDRVTTAVSEVLNEMTIA